MLELVTYATSDDGDVPEANWSELYMSALTRLSQAECSLYSRNERQFITQQLDNKAKKPGSRPSIDSLLRLAAIQAVSLVDFIRSPIQLSSPRLLNIGAAKNPSPGRRGTSVDAWNALRVAVESLLGSDDSVLLPSKVLLFQGTDLTPTGFWQHFPELSVAYERERRRRLSIDQGVKYRRILTIAEKLVASRRLEGTDVLVREDGAAICCREGVPKSVAERALNAALASSTALEELRRIFNPF